MKIYLNSSVLEEARRRVRWVLQEFEHVYVGFSGGKDSTVILNLALEAAEEMGRLPLPVFFLDQETEWQSVIDMVKKVMYDPRVSPRWLQIPFLLTNSASAEHPYLHTWDSKAKADWVRPQDPVSIKGSMYGERMEFLDVFPAFLRYHRFTGKACYLAGVRAEESPGRMLGLTSREVYKGVTWGKTLDRRRGHYTFYPIYDWCLSDVWKAIHDHGWPYCKLYDYMWQYGLPIRDMRVSSLHHETALKSLFYCQEVESETWERIQQRVHGINAVGQLGMGFYQPRELPPMFKSWVEYRDYLLDNLITNPDVHARFKREFSAYDSRYEDPAVLADLVQAEITTVIVHDVDLTKLRNFGSAHFMDMKNVGSKTVGGRY